MRPLAGVGEADPPLDSTPPTTPIDGAESEPSEFTASGLELLELINVPQDQTCAPLFISGAAGIEWTQPRLEVALATDRAETLMVA